MRMKILANESSDRIIESITSAHAPVFIAALIDSILFFRRNPSVFVPLCDEFARNDKSLFSPSSELMTRACTWRMLLCRFHIEENAFFHLLGKCLSMRNSCAQKQSAARCTKSDAVIYHSQVTDHCKSRGTRQANRCCWALFDFIAPETCIWVIFWLWPCLKWMVLFQRESKVG